MSIFNPDYEKKSSTTSTDPYIEIGTSKRKNRWVRNVFSSFKRNPFSDVLSCSDTDVVGFDHVAAARMTANSGLAHKLKSRHMQMMAIGGSIGTGLFVTTGTSLSTGGPASMIISYTIMSILMFCTIQALGEMAVLYPVAGSFSAYSTRFLDPAWGFAMGWNYAIQWLVILPLEIVAASITMSYWSSVGKVNEAVWVTVFLLLLIAINLFNVRTYGEAEFIFATIKVVAIISFIILGIILNLGGGPDGDYIGGRYWKTNNVPPNYPGYLLGQSSGSIASGAFKSENPAKSLPTAIKQVFWRICIFYLFSVSIVSLLVPHGDDRLLGKTSYSKASPFVIAIKNAGITVIPSLMNFVILIAVLSVGNSAIYGSSRTLAALADQGQAPRILAYIDRQGRPIIAIFVSSIVGFLCYLVAGGPDMAGTALKWLYSVSGLSSILTWGSICLAHIRYRAAWKAQGRSLNELTFRSQVGIVGSWIGFALNCLILIAQFWTSVWPIGFGSRTKAEIVQGFFRAYLTVPFVFVFYISYKLYYKTPFMSVTNIDIDTGRLELDTIKLNQLLEEDPKHFPRWKKIYKFMC
ncbi:General amino-acid permease GAP2 [Golovinomyces cichoracearum]|uniref:General amino-acid permease GAP2 n=1 Tax=Golovinomyces cichoracearum TaxID=62708 RepID=A0A420J3C7_9PEZI|nr:General amino-acid permease GAP2 [Golovinomyces cichoracearum]